MKSKQKATESSRDNREEKGSGTRNRDRTQSAEKSRDESGSNDRFGVNAPNGPRFELQRRYGNQAIQQLAKNGIQPKLKVGSPNDKYEREADRVAEAVTRTPDATPRVEGSGVSADRIQRMCPRCRRRANEGKPLDCKDCEKEVQRKEDTATSATASDGQNYETGSLGSSGRPLPESVRSYFEPRFSADFADVRVHTGLQADEAARSMNARAFTTGRHVGFRDGEFRPGTQDGRKLIAHELTHVLQQRRTNTNDVQREVDPGDCSYGEHRRLQDIVDEACKNRPRGCNASHTLAEIEERIKNNAECIAARKKINHKCFRGGDAGHQEALQVAVNTLVKCQRIKKQKQEQERGSEIDTDALGRVGLATALGAGAGALIGGIVGGLGGAGGGTLVAPGVGTVGGGIAGGAAGATKGMAIGAAAGGIIGGGIQSLIEWF